MEDDIDIEEHDLLDNPKIKSIFPDLSRVKIEIPDEEDEFEEVFDEETASPTDYDSQTANYSYEYSFVTDDVQSQEVVTECDNENYEYENRIILGTKKPIDYESLYEEALNSFPIVSLENWEHRLKSSPCYCPMCQTLFPTVNALDAHKMISHSYLVALDTPQKNTARKSTVPSKFCNHCSKTFPDDTSLIKHLYELLPLNNFPKKPEQPKGNLAKAKMESSKTNLAKTKMESSKTNLAKVKMESTKSNLKMESSKSNLKMESAKSNLSSIKNETSKPSLEPQYRCVKCKKSFFTFSGGKRHKKNHHPTLGHVNLIVKIQPKKKPEATVVKKTVLKRKMYVSSTIFPKSILFQCHNCHVCFISCFALIQHVKYCEKSIPFTKCEICKRKIRDKDKELHALQHTVEDKFKIITVQHNSIYEKVLCKCPKCLACFDELLFRAHYQNCDNAPASYCPDCDMNIAQARYKLHRSKHRQKKFTKKDFIIVEFHDTTLKKAQSGVKKAPNVTKKAPLITKKQANLKPSFKVKKQMHFKMGSKKYAHFRKDYITKARLNNITVYYCEACSCCIFTLYQKGHGLGQKCEKQRRYFCEDCGLSFTQKSVLRHRLLHKQKKFGLKDVKICNLQTGEIIAPPPPKMYTCNLKNCKINFLAPCDLKLHKCYEQERIICNICHKIYSEDAYKVHMHYHSLETLDVIDNTSDEVVDIPELMKKYNSINNMWNILYKCMNCALISKNYDFIVEHSQNHLNGIENDTIEICSTCDFKMAASDFSDHANLHLNNEDIDANSFRILSYSYEDLFKNTWMNVFRSLPKQHKEQILSKSIYRYTRIVKMRAEIQAHSETSHYFCMKCKSFVDAKEVQRHILEKCENNDTVACLRCEEIFKNMEQLFSHTCPDFDATNCNLIVFNDDADKVFNKLLFLKSKNVVDKTKKLSNNVKSVARIGKNTGVNEKIVGKKYKIFKCALCTCCVMMQNNIRRHSCIKENRRGMCRICKQNFSVNYLKSHLGFFHKRRPFIKSKDLVVVHFNVDKKEENSTEIDKKDTSVKRKSNVEKSSSIKNDTKNALPPTKCDATVKGKSAEKKSLSSKNYTKITVSPPKNDSKVAPPKIQTDPQIPEPVIIEKDKNKDKNENSATIYKCQCGLHFTSIKTILSHLDICSSEEEIASENCSKCQLLFPTELLVTHLCNHHSKPMKILIENVKKVELLKCINCSLLFKNEDLFNSHIEECDLTVTAGRKCGGCHLNFHRNSYYKHLCSFKDNITYINKISVIKNVNKVYPVYRCVQCNISYLNHPAYSYHIEMKHRVKMEIQVCEYCSLRFTRHSMARHLLIHKTDSPEYTIKVIDPETGNFVVLKGSNPNSPENKTGEVVNVKSKADNAKRKLDMAVDNDDNGNSQEKRFKVIESGGKRRKLLGIDTVYKCTECNICYLFHKSYAYHESVNHESKIEIKGCRYCNLRFTKKSMQKHERYHQNGGPDYKIKVIDAISGNFEILEGKNLKKLPSEVVSNENADLSVEKDKFDGDNNENNSFKRKLDIEVTEEIENEAAKRPRRSVVERKMFKYAESEPSSSKSDKVDDDVIFTDNSQDSFDDVVKTPFETLTEKVKSKILLEKYNNKLYRCTKCGQHALLQSSFYYHFCNVKCQGAENYKCQICLLDFSKQTLPRHVYVHHDKMGFKREDFDIVTEAEHKTWSLEGKVKVDDSSQLDDDASEVGNDSSQHDDSNQLDDDCSQLDDSCHVDNDSSQHDDSSQVDNDSSQLNDSVEIVEGSSQIANEVSDSKIESDLTGVGNVDEVDNNDEIDEVDKPIIKDEIDNIIYFKCSACNVCFSTAKSCFEHTFRHTVLDSKMYIQCKVCDFQFMIDSLKEHVNIHHRNDFDVNNLTIEEYKPQGFEIEPKIEIYKAVDKLQFGTVSTTSDMEVL